MENAIAVNVATAAADLHAARARLIEAMRAARAAGVSYREIGRLAGVSHETVRQLLRADDAR